MEVPFALSIHKFISSVGDDAGFAAFICVAVIGLLYFAQARETATLRDRLEDAHERIGGLEARIAQLMHLQSARQPVAPGVAPARVTPPPAVARPMGSAIPSVRRIPAATVAGNGPGPDAGATLIPAAPVGMGAPALASATKLIPSPALAAIAPSVPDDTVVVPAPVVAGAVPPANGNGEATAVTAAVPPPAGGGPTPPRVQIRTDGTGSGSTPRRTAPPAARPLGEARFDIFEKERSGGRSGTRGRRLPLAIGVLAVAVIIAGAVVITTSGNGTTNSTVNRGPNGTNASTSSSGPHKGRGGHKTRPFSASSVTVAVLNGTNVHGLAADVGTVLTGHGYKQGSITNAASQTEQSTTVYYMTAGYKSAAEHVAKTLKLSPASVQLATQTVIQSCATTPAAATTSCSGNVIVSVGEDKASLASSASSSAG
jgi:hypothetical protein